MGSTDGPRNADTAAKAEQRQQAVHAKLNELLDSPTRLAIWLLQVAADEQARVLLFVDQLEELYTLGSAPRDRQAFMEAVCAAADDPEGPVRVVLTLRDDFLGRIAETTSARNLLDRVFVLRTPCAEDLEQTIIRPVEACGYTFEDPAMVSDMVHSVAYEPAALSLIQFSAQRIWAARDPVQRTIPRAAWSWMGGVQGALAQHADGVLAPLPPDQVVDAKRVFLRLVTDHGTKRRLGRRQLLEGLPESAERTLDYLVRQRLLVAHRRDATWGDACYEIVHESLLKEWKTLAGWIELSRWEIAALLEVEQAAALWERRGCRRDETWSGDALAEAQNKLALVSPLPTLVARFLDASAREQRARARRKTTLIGAAIALLALTTLALLVLNRRAVTERDVAQQQRLRAEEQKRETAYEAARGALSRGDIVEGRARVRSLMEEADSTKLRMLWWRAQRQEDLATLSFGTPLHSVEFRSDGSLLAVGTAAGLVVLVDPATLQTSYLRALDSPVFEASFSPDGRMLVAVTRANTAHLWDLDGPTSKKLAYDQGISGASFDPDGSRLALARTDGTVAVVVVADGKTETILSGHEGLVRRPCFLDSSTLVSAGVDGTVLVRDTKTGRVKAQWGSPKDRWRSLSCATRRGLIAASTLGGATVFDRTGRVVRVFRQVSGNHFAQFSRDESSLVWGDAQSVGTWESSAWKRTGTWFHGGEGELESVALSPDKSMVAAALVDGRLRLWQTGGGPVEPHRGEVSRAAFSPNGKVIASAADDRTVRLFDTASGRVIRTIPQDNSVSVTLYSDDGTLLATAGTGGVIRIWQTSDYQPVGRLVGHTGTVMSLRFDTRGKTLISGASDGTLRFWDLSRMREIGAVEHGATIFEVAISPDGRTISSSGSDGRVRLVDARSRRIRESWQGTAPYAFGLAFAPGNRRLAITGSDGRVTLRDLNTRKQREVGRHEGWAYWIGFHPGGEKLVSAGEDGVAWIWDLKGNHDVPLKGHRGQVSSAQFSPDGRYVLTTGVDRTLRLWQAKTGRPVWRGVMLIPRSEEGLTHRGWEAVGKKTVSHDSYPWQRSIEEHGRLGQISSSGNTLCLWTWENQLQRWDIAAPQPVASAPVADVAEIAAVGDACLLLNRAGDVLRLDESGQTTRLYENVGVVAPHGDALLLSVGKHVKEVLPDGTERGDWEVEEGCSAVARIPDGLALGYGQGVIALVQSGREPLSLDSVPADRVIRLMAGPGNTLIAGFEKGQVCVWDLETRQRLMDLQLHGRLTQLHVDENKVLMMTELGDVHSLDFGMLRQGRCSLLNEVWQNVPAVWDGDRAVRRPSSHRHPCTSIKRN